MLIVKKSASIKVFKLRGQKTEVNIIVNIIFRTKIISVNKEIKGCCVIVMDESILRKPDNAFRYTYRSYE